MLIGRIDVGWFWGGGHALIKNVIVLGHSVLVDYDGVGISAVGFLKALPGAL